MATINAWNSNNPTEVSKGGTGVTSTTAYAVLCGGVTSTDPLQSIASVGTTGQVLISNGAGALPTFQNAITPYSSIQNTVSFTSSIFYKGLLPGGSSSAASTSTCFIPANGTIDRMYVNANTNTATGNTTATLYINGSPTSLVVTITAATPGVYSDLVNSVSVSAGDGAMIQLGNTTSGGIGGGMSVRFTPT